MRGLILLIVLLVSLFPLTAQTDRATLTGVVMDPSRSVVPGARIVLQSASTGIGYRALANSAGVYAFSGLPVGQYTASFAAPSFETLQIQTFTLEVGETRTLNATLRVGSVTSNVTVVDLLGSSSRLADTLPDGRQLSGIGMARTGLPLNVTLCRSASALPDEINGSQRPDVVPGQPLYPGDQGPALRLNPLAFTTPAKDTWGDAGRNILRAPGIWQADTALEKCFPIRERISMSFRAAVFNIFNRAQLLTPPRAPRLARLRLPYTTSAVGTGTPRQVQFMRL
jgi:hypothetical protein